MFRNKLDKELDMFTNFDNEVDGYKTDSYWAVAIDAVFMLMAAALIVTIVKLVI